MVGGIENEGESMPRTRKSHPPGLRPHPEANPPLAPRSNLRPRLVVVAGARHFHWADLLVEIVLFGVGLLAHLLAAVAEDVGQTG